MPSEADKKILSLLGLCTKSGNLVSGGFASEKAIKEYKACLVIIAGDASDNTKKHFSDMCNYRDIPYVIYGMKDSLGHAIGKEERTSVVITDPGFSKSLRKHLDELMQ